MSFNHERRIVCDCRSGGCGNYYLGPSNLNEYGMRQSAIREAGWGAQHSVKENRVLDFCSRECAEEQCNHMRDAFSRGVKEINSVRDEQLRKREENLRKLNEHTRTAGRKTVAPRAKMK